MKDLTRRALLAALPLGLGNKVSLGALLSDDRPPAKKAKALPAAGEFVRFADPLTESVIVRLTSADSASVLPNSRNRFISVRERVLICSSDRTGSMSPFRVDLRNGSVVSLGETAQLVPQSLCLDSSGRNVFLVDGGSLKEIAMASKRTRIVAEDVSGFSLGASRAIAFIRHERLYMLDGGRDPVTEQAATWCLLRPGNGGCLFGREQDGQAEFWYVALGAPKSAPVLLVRGLVSDPVWSPDGTSVLFLSRNPSGGSEICELSPETRQERKVASTSQFAAFSPNHDGSVFVGASSSKAQPAIILLLRSLGRELTLSEHRDSNQSAVSPVFSPDSRRIYFQSDQQGKSAIYSASVELLVEPSSAGNV